MTSTAKQIRGEMMDTMKHDQRSDDRIKTLEKENNDLKSRIKYLLHEHDETIEIMTHALLRVDTVESQRDNKMKMLSNMRRNLHRTTNELNVLKRLCNELHATPIPIDTPIVVLKRKWLKKYRSKEKALEIRGQHCCKEIGTLIFLTESGSDELTDRVEFGGSQKINSEREWEDLRDEHRNPHDERRYGDNTYAWKFNNCTSLKTTIPHKVYPGTVIWRKYFPRY